MVYNVSNQQRMLAAVSGDVNPGYAASITIGSGFQEAAAAKPSLTAGGIVNASSGGAGLAPTTWISIYGTNLTTGSKTVTSADLVGNLLPTALGGASVQVNGRASYMQYVSPPGSTC